MAIKASATITLSFMVDVKATYRYYKLQASTATAPSVPTTRPPSGWTDVEPSYTTGSTNTLYFVDCTVFTNNTFNYSAVSVSSAYEAAKEAFNKAVAAQNSVNEIPDYVASRGENLVTNGTCLLGNNKNFSNFTYDGSETYYAGGSFKVTGKFMEIYTDEFMPVDVSQKYALSYYIKCSNASAKFYDMLVMYDIDKYQIADIHVMFISGSTTTLAKELKNGDTTVYLSSVSGFYNTTTAYHQRGLIFWNYTNSKGYTYGVETYSRNIWYPLWSDSSAIDKTANTITLNSAWTNGTFPAGTPVSQCSGGNAHIYGNGNYAVTANTWTKKTAYWNGVGKNNDYGKFREGTAFIKLGWLMNHGIPQACDTWLSTVSLTKSAGNSEVSKLVSTVDVEYYLSTSATSLSGGSWSTTAPTWVNGKYMWSRTKITNGAGTVTYKPSSSGTCIAGAKGDTGATGATGTGISSITEEYYLSTSKTSQSGGSWTTTPPTWSSGKYIWTRSKIVYTNPSSTAYTTPLCDSSWEAVNEVEIGGRNLLRNTGDLTKWIKESGISVTPDSNGWYKVTDSSHTSNRWGIYQNFSGYEQNTDYTVSLYLKKGSNIGYLSLGYNGSFGDIAISGSSNGTWYSYTFNTGSNPKPLRIYICFYPKSSAENFYVKLPKLEKGNRATDWTPAPEDVDSEIEDAKNEAAKTATNYIYYDTTNGLQIGDKSSGKWAGTRAQIKADSYNILNQNGVELASFGANEVRLGNESEDATISMRKGSLNISNLNKGDYDYTQIGCKGNLDVSSEDYTSDTKYKKGGMLTTIDHESLIEWQNLRNYKWNGLKSYTWDDLNGIEFVAQRDKYFETRLYSEERDDSSSNGFNGARVSLKTSIGSGDNTITSEIDLQADKINLKGKIMLDYMMPVGYIFQWVPTTGGPDLSTADKVKAYYGFGTWEEISGRFLLGRSSSYGVGSVGGNETHTHTNPATGSWSGTSGSTAITVAQMPSHSHGLEGMYMGGWSGWPWQSWGAYVFNWGDTVFKNSNASTYNGPGVRATNGMYIDNNGGGQGHTHSLPSHNHSMGSTGSTNSMPPYLSVYIWKRIA